MQPMQSSAFDPFFICVCDNGSGKPGYAAVRSIHGSKLATLRSNGVRSTTRSRRTGRLRNGSIVIAGSTASQQASTSRPFMRTAQVPHIFEPQNQR